MTHKNDAEQTQVSEDTICTASKLEDMGFR